MGDEQLSFEEEYAALMARQEDEIKQMSSPIHLKMHGISKEELEESLEEVAVEHAKQKKELCSKHGKKVPE